MSRLDKQQHQEQVVGTARDTSVRLFAFANTRPRYQVVFAPEEPLIILKTKKSATPQHPCQQWEPLSSLIFHARPNTTHAVYVADTTEMSSVPMHEQEEHVNGAAVGPLLKRLGNTLIRLNPHDATMVAAGVSAHLGLKYVLVGEKTLGHRDRLVRRLVLVCPTPLSSFVALTNAVIKKPAAEGYPLPEVVVLLKDAAEVPAWTAWLTGLRDTHGRIASFTITTDLAPTLFAAIAREAGVAEADGTAVDVLQRHPSPRVYRIDFVLSKQTKTVIQLPRLSPLSTLGYDEDDDEDEDGHDHDGESAEGSEEGEEEEEEEAFEDDDGEEGHHAGDGAAHGHAHSTAHNHSGCGSGCCDHDHHHGDEHGNEDGDREGEGGSMLVSGVQSLAHWCDPVRVIVEGRVLDLSGGLVGTTDGCVEVPNLKEVVNADPSLSAFLTRSSSAAATVQKGKAQKPPAVAIAATLDRDDEGRTTLLAEEVRPLTKAEVRQSMTAGASLEEIPVHYNASRIAHSYGALLVRGRKCALVRNVETAHADPHLRIPSAPHSAATESSMECAVRALCDACEVSSDNFYLPSYLPPVLYYAAGDGSGVPRCVTIYTALAISPPPRGPASDAVEDAPEYGEPYDWVSFERALTLVATEAEREALREAQQHLAKAQRAGFYTPFKGCGTFGDAVRPLPGLSSGGAASAAPPLSSGSTKGSAAAAAARSAAPARPATLAGVELYVVACPGDAANELLPMLRRALQTSSVLVCDADTTTAAIESAAAEALRCGDRSVLLYLPEDDADAEAFCEAHLVELTEERHATAQVFVALLPSVAHSILDLSGTAAVKAEAEMRLDALLSAARVSDALVTLVPPEQLSPAEVALLRVCCKANADLSLIYSWEARRPFELAEQSSSNEGAAAAAPHLKQVALTLPAGVPVAPAALAFLTHAGALDCFFMDGACRLLFAQGDVWIPTRGSTQGFVYLDVTSHCLAVEPGEEYEGQSNSTRTSVLSLVLWCAGAAAAAKAEAQAATMAAQLQWSEERDGADWASAHDPLPKWE